MLNLQPLKEKELADAIMAVCRAQSDIELEEARGLLVTTLEALELWDYLDSLARKSVFDIGCPSE